MAKIQTETIVIVLSKLVKDSELGEELIAGHEVQDALEQVVQELVGDKVIVEIERK